LYVDEDDLLFYGTRLLIPKTLRFEILNVLHNAHQGAAVCKLKAQDTVFWPGISTDIENFVSNCVTCRMTSRANSKMPLYPHEVPDGPWMKLGVDFFSYQHHDYILVVDYFSKFISVQALASKTASSVVGILKNLFCVQGLPQVIFSDNGPPFNSLLFKQFAQKYNITLETSSPYHSQSNGMVERSIQTIKNMLVKTNDLFLTVLEYNASPKVDLPSPSQMLMGRRLRTVLPAHKDVLKPTFDCTKFYETLKSKQLQQKVHYDKSSHQLPPFRVNDKVFVRNAVRAWTPAEVVGKLPFDSYLVHTDDDKTYRRNRTFLKPQPSTRSGRPIIKPVRLDL
jgi:hypothetical protein